VKNPYLERCSTEKGQNTDAVWDSILEQEGSVQHLDFLSQDEKDVFKTAFEIDQRWVIELAADRTPDICQSQSVNLFLPGDVDKWDLHMLHWMAWERGCKSLYYLRSKSVQRAGLRRVHRTLSLGGAEIITLAEPAPPTAAEPPENHFAQMEQACAD
jgi:ribonucleoside-diphosphate reductase alpha chain